VKSLDANVLARFFIEDPDDAEAAANAQRRKGRFPLCPLISRPSD